MQKNVEPSIDIFKFEDYRVYLKTYYDAKKKKSPSFSYRFVANKVGFSAGYFSRILNGQKNLTAKHILAFAKLLKLNMSETHYFEAMVLYNHGRNLNEKTLHYERMLRCRSPKNDTISRQQYEYYAQWYHSAIRAVVGIFSEHEELDPATISSLLTPVVSIKDVKKSLRLLKRLGFIVQSKMGYKLKDTYIKSGHKPNEMAVRNFLRTINELGKDGVDRFEPNERKYSSVTLGISEQCYAELLKKMAGFLEEVHQLVHSDENAERVYQLNLQLFPLCKSKGRKK